MIIFPPVDAIRRGIAISASFEDHLKGKKMDPGKISTTLSYVQDLKDFLAARGKEIADCDLDLMDEYLAVLIDGGQNSSERLVAMARFCDFQQRRDLFIRLATILNSHDILPLMEERVTELFGEEKREAIFHGFVRPPLGTPPEKLPPFTGRIVHRMEGELNAEQCRKALVWNYHEVPRETFKGMKERYERSEGLDEFLAEEHKLLVEELRECLRTGKVWYEQEVTPEFIEQVAADQRLNTGVREGDRIICTKVPFDPKKYYGESDPILRRYHYCHCPLARSSIRDGGQTVSSTFCYCSAGFTKLAWDVIFEEDVQVEVLETVLGGDERCTFSIHISGNVIGR